jgi:hypothetical protein
LESSLKANALRIPERSLAFEFLEPGKLTIDLALTVRTDIGTDSIAAFGLLTVTSITSNFGLVDDLAMVFAIMVFVVFAVTSILGLLATAGISIVTATTAIIKPAGFPKQRFRASVGRFGVNRAVRDPALAKIFRQAGQQVEGGPARRETPQRCGVREGPADRH